MLDAGFVTVDAAAFPAFLDRRRPMRMMTSIVACAFTTIVAGAANAADLRLKAPPPPAIYSWTGVYAGLNVGGGIGVNSNLQNASFSSTVFGVNGLLSDS